MTDETYIPKDGDQPDNSSDATDSSSTGNPNGELNFSESANLAATVIGQADDITSTIIAYENAPADLVAQSPEHMTTFCTKLFEAFPSMGPTLRRIRKNLKAESAKAILTEVIVVAQKNANIRTALPDTSSLLQYLLTAASHRI